MSSEPRTALRSHGGLIGEEIAALELDPADIVDFSVNVNPYGPSSAVLEAARTAAFDRYPDPTAWPLRRAIARRNDVHPEQIVVGSGAADLFWTLARVLVRPGERALVVGPTFAEFPAAVKAAGGQVLEWRADAARAFAVNPGAIANQARLAESRFIYLCAPNNPTGVHVPVEEVCELASALSDVTVVLDQAFLGLSTQHAEVATALPASVICVRSMTKDHAIPGLRLGYLIAAPALAARIEAGRPPWMVNAPAQAAGLAALAEDTFVASCRTRLLADRDSLAYALRELGWSPLPSETTFFMVPVSDPTGLRLRLLKRGLLIRDCTSFGLPGHIRLAARPAPDRARLVAALREETAC
jgi:histidinol-phosphate/aromatic aminotransferase/cobyric acid decarboxylase-like protein